MLTCTHRGQGTLSLCQCTLRPGYSIYTFTVHTQIRTRVPSHASSHSDSSLFPFPFSIFFSLYYRVPDREARAAHPPSRNRQRRKRGTSRHSKSCLLARSRRQRSRAQPGSQHSSVTASAPGSARSRADRGGRWVLACRPCMPPRFVYARVPLAAARRALPLAREGKDEATE